MAGTVAGAVADAVADTVAGVVGAVTRVAGVMAPWPVALNSLIINNNDFVLV